MIAYGLLELVPPDEGWGFPQYVLTDKGRALLPAAVALNQWGEKYFFDTTEERTTFVDRKFYRPL